MENNNTPDVAYLGWTVIKGKTANITPAEFVNNLIPYWVCMSLPKTFKTNVPCFTPFINAEPLFDCNGARYGFRIKTLKNAN